MLIVKAYVAPVRGKGFGLFASEFISKGKIWWVDNRVINKIITKEQLELLPELTQRFVVDESAFTTKDGDYYIMGDNGRYQNHSENPNTAPIRSDCGGGCDWIAIKDINPGDEITGDYRVFYECKDKLPFIDIEKEKGLKLFQSTDINDYKFVLEGLVEDFGFVYYHAVLAWCNIISGRDNKYWQVWLISFDGRTIGTCGLYSLFENRTDELWLAWFGIIKEYRNKGIGTNVLDFLEKEAQKVGCKILRSYVDENGKPLEFYKRNGFNINGRVQDYINSVGSSIIMIDDFENMNDWVIEKIL